MQISKSFFVWILTVLFAVLGASQAKAQEVSKFDICLKASFISVENFDRKQNNLKLKYAKVNDIFEALLLKPAAEIGYYKAKSIEEAASKGFASCVEHKIWK